MRSIMLIGLAGATGSLLRFGLSTAVYAWLGTAFPWGTLAVNVLGCLAIGVVMQASLGGWVSPELRTIIAVGLLGGFTTFSSFGYETLLHMQKGEWLVAGSNVAVSVVLGLAAVWLGMTLARGIWGVA